jgi:hypothetical protein
MLNLHASEITSTFLIKEDRIVGTILAVILLIVTYYYSKNKKDIYIRNIPAVQAIDEAVGRAAEMGRPIVCSYGAARKGMDFWTVSALSILSHTAEKCAETGAKLIVPLSADPSSLMTHPIAKDLVKSSYTKMRAPELYDENDFRQTGSNFRTWAMNYAEILYEVQPAANIFTGYIAYGVFLAEQSGAIEGCMSIGSSFYLSAIAMIAISCDYTLISTDIIAAGAYFTEDPEQKGFLRTLDIFSLLMIALILLGSILVTAGIDFVSILGV